MNKPWWRVGRSIGRTLYKDGVCVGMVDTKELAAEIVDAMNASTELGTLIADVARSPWFQHCGLCCTPRQRRRTRRVRRETFADLANEVVARA